ncbi:MAG: metalloregulator ArsR/SmtB family transcription factor [Betaproteobacteria bacterium]|nr:metalloregulator ArsR/SmtB family transcription factor [Betaproteobacteria bacterium]
MSSTNVKSLLFAEFARVSKALGSGNRLELLEFLAQGERSVDTLAKLSGLSVANTSRHLQVLRQAGLVAARKEGLFVFYSVSGEGVIKLLAALQEVAQHNVAEVTQLVNTYLTSKDSLEPLSVKDLADRMRSGLVTVVDVRPKEEYAAGHLPGAINIPLADIEKNLSTLPRDREIIAYCRGPFCVLSFEAVAQLRKEGLKARRLETGFPEWKVAGLPVE